MKKEYVYLILGITITAGMIYLLNKKQEEKIYEDLEPKAEPPDETYKGYAGVDPYKVKLGLGSVRPEDLPYVDAEWKKISKEERIRVAKRILRWFPRWDKKIEQPPNKPAPGNNLGGIMCYGKRYPWGWIYPINIWAYARTPKGWTLVRQRKTIYVAQFVFKTLEDCLIFMYKVFEARGIRDELGWWKYWYVGEGGVPDKYKVAFNKIYNSFEV
jgi:hypothetical protein